MWMVSLNIDYTSRNRVVVPARQATGGIDSLKSIPGLLKSLKMTAQL
jgi:hypothetical protein